MLPHRRYRSASDETEFFGKSYTTYLAGGPLGYLVDDEYFPWHLEGSDALCRELSDRGGIGLRTLRGGYLPFGTFVDNPGATSTMPRLVFEPGFTARFLPAKNFGLYLDLALNLGSPSLSVNHDILGVFLLKLGTGISVRF